MKVRLDQLEKQIRKDLALKKKEATSAVAETSRKAVHIVQRNAPKAFGELADSVHSTGTATVVTAPHAEAVEVGSRPHLVPLEELVKWVKLRGMQSTIYGPHPGSTSGRQAYRIGQQFDALRNGRNFTPIDAPRKIAKAIQAAILKHGTKPTRFVMRSLPEVADILNAEMQKVFK